MTDRVEDSDQRTDRSERDRPAARSRLFKMPRVRAVLTTAPRLILLCVIVWAFTGPVDRMPMIVGAAALAPAAPPVGSTLRASSLNQAAGFAVADGPIASYFAARGGVRTFGPPVSNAFPLLGATVQIFRDHVLKVEPNGAVSTVNLFSMGAIPFRNVGGRVIPEIDPYLIATAPVPGTPDYAARVQGFIREVAVDQWEGMPVGFYQAFLGTVRAEDALPNGGERALLTGFSHEIWGVPVSRPMRDAQDPNVVLLRWERGVMAWSRQTGTVTTIPLGETFKQVLTGEGLGPERTAAAAGSQFLMQAKQGTSNGVARPNDLPNTVLASAFTQGAPAVNAAQLASGANNVRQGVETPTPTLTPPVPAQPVNNLNPPPPPPPPPPGAVAGVPPPPAPGLPAAPVPGAPVPGAPAAAVPPAAPAGVDACFRDEQITFAPTEPRANNELLIAVTSSRAHPYGRLTGTEKPTFVRERAGQLGWVGEWTVALTFPGKHTYTFSVDSTIPCKSIELTVRSALATRTPTPLPTATPYGWDNGNSNGNSNTNTNGNNNDNNSGLAPFRDLTAYWNQTQNLVDCPFFLSQGEAQRTLRANPADPNQIDIEDGVRDGIACSTSNYTWSYPDDRDFNIVAVTTPIPTLTPTAVGTPTRAQRVPGAACAQFPNGKAAQDFLRANPTDPLFMDFDRNGIACGGADGPTIGGVQMSQPFWDGVPVPTNQYPPNP